MSIEVEIKLKISDRDKLIEDLYDAGFRQGNPGIGIRYHYYTSRHHDFEKLDEALLVM